MFAGIDVGTTNAKMTVYQEDGKEIARASCSYRNRSLHSIPAYSIWNAVADCILDISGRLASYDRIDALAVSSFGESVAVIDKQGLPLSDIILRTSKNGGEELAVILDRMPEERIVEITGLFPDRRFSLVKMKWYKERTDLYDKVYKFLTIESYIIFMLTGGFYTSESTAWRTMAYDVNRLSWSEDLLNVAELDGNKLPEALPSGSFCGLCQNAVSAKFQILEGTRVYTGGHDQFCNAVGSGLTGNDLLNCSGTVECISSVIGKIGGEEKDRLKIQQIRYPEGIGRFFSFWAPVSGCSALDWCLRFLYSDRFSEENKNILHREMQRFCRQEPTKLMAAPYFNGRGYPDIYGFAHGSIEGLDFNTSPAEFYQGVMEGIAFEDRICLEKMLPYKTSGRKSKVLMAGGGANSEYWMRMKANIYGRDVVKLEHSESGTMGAMIFAAIGEGCYGSFGEAFKNCIKVKEVYSPDDEMSERYHKKYLDYLLFRGRLAF